MHCRQRCFNTAIYRSTGGKLLSTLSCALLCAEPRPAQTPALPCDAMPSCTLSVIYKITVHTYMTYVCIFGMNSSKRNKHSLRPPKAWHARGLPDLPEPQSHVFCDRGFVVNPRPTFVYGCDCEVSCYVIPVMGV